ncbi:hypothetical protein BDB00DRAFT_828469 [Zychaea mexicana]|uniref:uncharacterized protein n=1 Tax=Zychaea mexicana TaxID=64656 RepID=UPI0022FE4375|nr:uncharacterized protein BDB00DRAFT_828469 [Zychaea mexicana]KAI9492494.1 hypothetical protein BDB00DRAFT_828469 [Zychaea mexicana]
MSTEAGSRTALVLGATGAVGKQLLLDVLKNGNYSRVITLGRRPAPLDDSIPQQNLEQKTVDFDNLEASRAEFRNVNDVYCCLGTTRADAGSAEAFRRIDQTYVLNSAKIIAEENKPTTAAAAAAESSTLSPVHFLYCSSKGSNKNSMFLYPQSKGQTEEGIIKAGFQRVSIFLPGFLEVQEPRPRSRLGEQVLGAIFTPVNRYMNLHMAIPTSSVGQAMHKVAMQQQSKAVPADAKETKVEYYSNKDMEDLTKPSE